MALFSVYYKKKLFDNVPVTKAHLKQTHVGLKSVCAENIEDVFYKMQGEIWSPNGEARGLILSKGLSHTSMTVGDVVYNFQDHQYYVVDDIGFSVLRN